MRFESREFVNALFGGNLNYGVYIHTYCLMYNDNIQDLMKKGPISSNLPSFISQHFETEPFTSYKAAIDKGHVVLVDIPTKYNFTHCVVIIGYHPDGRLIYMDPELGRRMECLPTFPIGNIKIIIKGNK